MQVLNPPLNHIAVEPWILRKKIMPTVDICYLFIFTAAFNVNAFFQRVILIEFLTSVIIIALKAEGHSFTLDRSCNKMQTWDLLSSFLDPV